MLYQWFGGIIWCTVFRHPLFDVLIFFVEFLLLAIVIENAEVEIIGINDNLRVAGTTVKLCRSTSYGLTV